MRLADDLAELPDLYPRLLGDGWGRLPNAVKKIHYSGKPISADGQFRITAGQGLVRKLIARMMGLPRPSERCMVRLAISHEYGGERWTRWFGDHRLSTRQEANERGELVESFRRLQITYQLDADAGGIHYKQTGCRLKVGPIGLRLPYWAAPRVEAAESADESGIETLVSVSVAAPLVGIVVRYAGTIKPIEDDQCR